MYVRVELKVIKCHEMKCDFKKSSKPAMSRAIMIYRAICHLNLCGHFFKPLSISSTKSLVGYYWAVVHGIETQASALRLVWEISRAVFTLHRGSSSSDIL